MRTLVTGATGFVGRHLLGHLLEQSWEVAGTHLGPPAPEVRELQASGVRLYPLDVTDGDACEALFQEVRPEVCLHLAGEAAPGRAKADPGAALAVNALGSWNVARALGRAGGAVMVLASTSKVYGEPRAAAVDEGHPLDPAGAYGISKLAAEELVRLAAAEHGFREVRLRLFNHIGPGQGPGFVVPDLARRLREEEPPFRAGNLDVRRDFTDVRDVVRAYALAAATPEVRGVFNVGRGEAVPVRDLFEGLARELGRPAEFRTDPALVRPGEPEEIRAEIASFHRLTGWEPEIPLERTLADVAASLGD